MKQKTIFQKIVELFTDEEREKEKEFHQQALDTKYGRIN